MGAPVSREFTHGRVPKSFAGGDGGLQHTLCGGYTLHDSVKRPLLCEVPGSLRRCIISLLQPLRLVDLCGRGKLAVVAQSTCHI